MAVNSDPVLVRICDLAGRPRGTGFIADDLGTLVTTHEAVDGLSRVVLHAPGDRTYLAEADAITPLPERDLALVRTEGLSLSPLAIGTERSARARVRLRVGGWLDTELIGTSSVTYTSTDRFHPIENALELALPEAATVQLRLSAQASGTPLLDAGTGAVLAVLGTALHAPHRGAGFAVPIRTAAGDTASGTDELCALLTRNETTVPAFGPDLNLAGTLQLTRTVIGSAAPPEPPDRLPRPEVAEEFRAFTAGDASVLGLVGAPGTGRTTELAAWARERALAGSAQPTVWLRGAELRAADGSLRDAVGRALAQAGWTVAAGEPTVGDPWQANPDVVARLARDAGRPLLVLLDAPEEMPPYLAHELRRWATGTASWLRASGARLAVACRPEFWEQAGRLFPDALLHQPTQSPTGPPLPACVRLGDLPQGHPLTLRMRTELPETGETNADRHEIFAAWLDLLALRIALRAAGRGRNPLARDSAALRRLAVRAAGRLHEAAQACLGHGQGGLDRAVFETVFPVDGGWASAVLAEGALVPAGEGYRFADEEFGDWLQGTHLDIDGALDTLIHTPPGDTAGIPVPRHRIGPVAEALLLLDRTSGPVALAQRLHPLITALDANGDGDGDGYGYGEGDAAWWAARLLAETLPRLPDAGPYMPVLRILAARLVRDGATRGFGPWFWTRLPLSTGHRCELLRQLLPLDPAPPSEGDRFLDATAELLAADPRAAQHFICRWFGDNRPLRAPGATVATAAQALLHTHRRYALDDLAEALLDAAHPRADELLAELQHDEPAALCRAVHRWAHDNRAERRTAAATYALRLAPCVEADREQLRHAALALLRHPEDDSTLHSTALALLVSDPVSRTRQLPAALAHFASTDTSHASHTSHTSPELIRALGTALTTHPGPVFAAFQARLRAPAGPESSAAPLILRTLARVRTPALARQAARLVREYAQLRPDAAAAPVAAFAARRLQDGPAARATLHPLLADLLTHPAPRLRAALGHVLATEAPTRPLAAELLDLLLTTERDPAVLAAVRGATVPRPQPQTALRTAGQQPAPPAWHP
ncbi:S1C family serine protease [Streptomyces gobiensis]|uniref:S1C family serine protease n=1 Tax=Streptomyces gobiensis TaxID=2875706 RepID=UPI0024111A55|nr:S1C family serine protease [Streptomyces gobiensis]